jgi:ABC-type Mn2+/Zn2+ transport system ATPase subunit
MAYNQFHDCAADTAHVIVNIPPKPPEDTLLKEGVSVIKRLPYWKRFAMLFFAIAMVLFPIGINWMNIQMIRSISNGLALVFVGVRVCECAIDTLRELFLVKLGINAEVSIVIQETARYALFSKPTTYRHPAEKVIAKDLINAASALNRIIEWGMQSVTSTIGQIISSIVLLVSMELEWYDGIAFVLFGLVFWRVLMPLQKLMTERMEKHRNKYNKCNNLMSFRSTEFQNKECVPGEISNILNEPIAYDGQIRPLYIYTFRTIDLTMIAIMGVYAWFLPNDNLFAVKYVLVNTISSAISSIAQFGTQYHRYCNEYEKYYNLFRDPELKYDEYVAPDELPETLVLEKVELHRGEYVISCEDPISINQGDNLKMQGPSGAGKSSFLDGFMGFIPGIILDTGVNIRAYAHQIVCHLQNAQSISLSSVTIYEVFRSTDNDSIREVLDLFFEQDELDRVLSNISAENPFDTHIEGKMSGGQKTRFFLAATLFKAIQKKAKIIFLDEPEQGQDPDLQIKSFKAINEFASQRRLTIFWITHLRPEPLAETEIQFNTRLRFHKGGSITVA